MPLTPFQHWVLHLLAANRNPESHVGGGAVINRSGESPRYSADLDVFHDAAETVARCAEADAAILSREGLRVDWHLRQTSHHRATVSRGPDNLRLDWSYDS